MASCSACSHCLSCTNAQLTTDQRVVPHTCPEQLLHVLLSCGQAVWLAPHMCAPCCLPRVHVLWLPCLCAACTQARNYVSRKEQERKRRELFDDALAKFNKNDIEVRTHGWQQWRRQ